MSETTPYDVTLNLNQLASGLDNKDPLSELFKRWNEYMKTEVLTVQADSFWAFPHPFNMMKEVDPKLILELGDADLIIFKGDLNYGKLVGDLNWETIASFKSELQGFLPTSILSLRTAKTDVMVGLGRSVIFNDSLVSLLYNTLPVLSGKPDSQHISG